MTDRSHHSHNQETTRVLYNSYTGNWTTFSQPGVLTVWLYVKDFIYLFVTMHTFKYNNSSSCCTYHSLKNFVEKYFGFKKLCVENILSLMLTQENLLTAKQCSTHHCLRMGTAQLLDCRTTKTTNGRVIIGELFSRLPILFGHL